MFCAHCGQQIDDDAKFCGHCGKPTGAVTLETHEPRTASYTLTLIREKQLYVVNPAMSVYVDDNSPITLDNGAQINIPITEGAHRVLFKCGPRKREQSIVVNGNLVLVARWNRITGAIDVR